MKSDRLRTVSNPIRCKRCFQGDEERTLGRRGLTLLTDYFADY